MKIAIPLMLAALMLIPVFVPADIIIPYLCAEDGDNCVTASHGGGGDVGTTPCYLRDVNAGTCNGFYIKCSMTDPTTSSWCIYATDKNSPCGQHTTVCGTQERWNCVRALNQVDCTEVNGGAVVPATDCNMADCGD